MQIKKVLLFSAGFRPQRGFSAAPQRHCLGRPRQKPPPGLIPDGGYGIS